MPQKGLKKDDGVRGRREKISSKFFPFFPDHKPTFIGNSCYVKRKRGALEKSWLILKNVILYKKATALWNSVLQTVIH